MPKDKFEFFRIIYRFFADADRLTWISTGVAVVTGFLYFRFFFPKRDGFNQVPDDYTAGPDYQWLKWKVIMFILISAGAGVLAYYQLPEWFPRAFKR